MFIGLLFVWYSNYALAQIGGQFNNSHLVLLLIIQGLGIGFFMLPVMKISISTVDQAIYGLLSSMTNFFRNIGTSMGIAIAVFIYQSSSQRSWYHLSKHVYENNPAYLNLVQHWQSMGLNLAQQHAMLMHLVAKQSSLMGFNNAFLGIAIVTLIIGLFVFVMRFIPTTQYLLQWIKKS